jgi:TRAP-type transport system large permease protein
MTVLVFLGSLFGAMALGTPVAFCLLATAIALMWYIDFPDPQIIAQGLLGGADNFPLLAIPFFLLAGEVMNVGGMSRRLVVMATALVGHVRGGLGYVVILAGVIMAALSGSAVADAAALGSILIPMMKRAGHRPSYAAGLICSAGVIGPIIPPSIPMIIFGVVGGVSITKLFLSGVVPGLMLGGSIALVWWFISRTEELEAQPRKSFKDMIAATRESLWALVLPFIIIFGLRFGVFTPTEAGVVAAGYALFVSLFVYRELKFKDLYHVLLTAGRTTGVVMFLVAAAIASSWMITLSEVAANLAEVLAPLTSSPTLLMSVLMLIVFIAGMLMDLTPVILILTPIVMPLVKAAHIDPVYFGLMFTINGCIGLVTPPVGTVLNTVAGVSKLSLEDVARGALPFLAVELAILVLLIAFPQLVLVPLRVLTGG